MNARCIFAILTWLFFAAPLTAAADDVAVVLSKSSNPADAGKTSIVVTIENNGDAPVTISKAFLPFVNGPLPNNQFDVRSLTGQEQKYIGDWDYVAGASADSFIHLGAHQQLSGKVELRHSYAFDTQVDNHFTVQYRLPLGIFEEGNEPDENSPAYPSDPNRSRTIESNILQLTVDPYSPIDPLADSKKHDAGLMNLPKASTLETSSGYSINDPEGTCDAEQQLAIINAFVDADTAISYSLNYVRSMFRDGAFDPAKPASASWVLYFGEYNGDGKMPGEGGSYYAGRAGVVVSTMRAAQYATQSDSGNKFFPETECGCPPNTDSEVAAKARGSYHLLLCPKFFELKPKGGPYSRALTLYHEMTHFKTSIDNGTGNGAYFQVAGTGDYRYTGYADRWLAKNEPEEAVRNAENYEKFAIDAVSYYDVSGW